MGFDRFRDFCERLGFWKIWYIILAVVLGSYGLFIVFTHYVGPYIVGLWLAGYL